MSRPTLLSAFSGFVWAGIAWLIMERPTSPFILVPILASPFIGMLMGIFSKRFLERSILSRASIALGTLYFAAALWGVAIGIVEYFSWRTISAIFMPAWAAVWVLTYGWFVVLWPLSYMNHSIIGKSGADDRIRT